MGTIVLTDANVEINAVDLSDHVQQIAIDYGADPVEDTNMGDLTHIFKGGLKNWSMDITFSQDFAASEVDATLFAAVGTQVVVAGRPTSGAISATNPEYTGTGLIQDYAPFGNSVGELGQATLHVASAGDLDRDVTP